MSSSSNTDRCGDDSFGPFVTTLCRGGFDFTVLFEASILTIGPAACFLLLVPFRLFSYPDNLQKYFPLQGVW